MPRTNGLLANPLRSFELGSTTKITAQQTFALALMTGLVSTSTANAHDGHAHHQASIGMPGIESQVSRIIDVEMTDAMKFESAEVSVTKGETIHFVVHNGGKLRHEFVLGSPKATARKPRFVLSDKVEDTPGLEDLCKL